MELRDYVRAVRDQWLLIVAVAVLGLVVAFGISATATKTYLATAKLIVTATPTTGPQGAYPGLQFVLQRMKTYTELDNSNAVLQPVIDQLHLDTTVRKLAKQVSITNPTDTTVLLVSASESNADHAAQIANSVADSLSARIVKLENPSGARRSTVSVSIPTRAVQPSSPSSPRTTLNVALGLVAGLAVGLILAIVREQTNARIRGGADLRRVTSIPALGLVPRRRRIRKHPLTIVESPTAPTSEAFRQVFTRLALSGEHLPRKLVVTAPTAGAGRTVTAVNLALAAAQSGLRVCLVEADLRRPRLASYLGVTPEGNGLVAAVEEGTDGVVQSCCDGALDVLVASAPSDPHPVLASGKAQQVIDELASRYELVVVSAPPLLSVSDALLLARQGDGIVLVVRSHRTTFRDLAQSVDSAAAVGVDVLGCVITFTRGWRARRGHYEIAAVAGVVGTTGRRATKLGTQAEGHSASGSWNARRRRGQRVGGKPDGWAGEQHHVSSPGGEDLDLESPATASRRRPNRP